ncbi:MAG: hotdog fold thioesterase [Crocinitomicaceae bacterium]|nr:hotdog fold thioesterase [Crocinitomicaceae bacterium]
MIEMEIIQSLNELGEKTLMKSLGMKITVLKPGYVEGTMPVDQRTHQPFGLLHGGASAALAETLGSIGSYLLVKDTKGLTVGVELNINHLRSKRSGIVTGKATIIHQGRTTHVWNIEIADEEGKLLAISRLTVMIKSKEQA